MRAMANDFTISYTKLATLGSYFLRRGWLQSLQLHSSVGQRAVKKRSIDVIRFAKRSAAEMERVTVVQQHRLIQANRAAGIDKGRLRRLHGRPMSLRLVTRHATRIGSRDAIAVHLRNPRRRLLTIMHEALEGWAALDVQSNVVPSLRQVQQLVLPEQDGRSDALQPPQLIGGEEFQRQLPQIRPHAIHDVVVIATNATF